ncbi:acyl-CoA thioesterase [Variovorax sp. RT4R15]|uniref:acyl-CoA thioesterase n=1 Tax=Variovorax sp. RT4R15 TaxID=3443737 RepID=UPI003F482BDC
MSLRAEPEVVLRVIPMPADTVLDDKISGGWVMSKLDQAGSVLPARFSSRRFALVGVERLVFAKPVLLGDIVTFYAVTQKVGTTSISVEVSATTERRNGSAKEVVTSCVMTYVALDEGGRPAPIG